MPRENRYFCQVEALIQIPVDARPGDQLVLDPTAELVASDIISLIFRHPGQPVTPRNPVPSNEPAR